MKVKCFIAVYSEKEVEIDDKFKVLATEKPSECNIPLALYDEALTAVEKATGAKMDDSTNGTEVILSVRDNETGSYILEL